MSAVTTGLTLASLCPHFVTRMVPSRSASSSLRLVTRVGATALALFVTLAASTSPVCAQKPDGRLNGAVIDKTTGAPIVAAVVVFLGDGRSALADSTGKFRFENLPSGLLRFTVRAKGFPSGKLLIALAKSETMERQVELDSVTVALVPNNAQPLPKVNVEAAASLGPRFANFERRRATGAGHYVVADEIEKNGFSNLQEVVRGMRGVTVECGGGLGCHIRMSRAPMQCLPEYVVDDNVDNMFGPNIPVRDIQALEVYTGPTDVPGEYAGRNAGCGVIVIWTKSGPPRRKK